MPACHQKRTEAVLIMYGFLNFAYVFVHRKQALAHMAGCERGFKFHSLCLAKNGFNCWAYFPYWCLVGFCDII